jgi:nucleoside-diphosphate-sugar epimerase
VRVFLTGATGFIGSHIVSELLGAGHQVLGLTRSEAGARSLREAGADAHFGNLDDIESIRAGAADADAVIHTAFDHNFAHFVANCEKDRRIIQALGDTLRGSSRPLIITSGTGMGDAGLGKQATEDVFHASSSHPRVASELQGEALLQSGVDVRVVRLPQVHNKVKQGLVSFVIAISREKRLAAYVEDGANLWPAAHVSDVARLYTLAIDKGQAGARYHAVGEEGIAFKEIAALIGAALGVPVISLPAADAPQHFGWLAELAGLNMPASASWTRQALGWEPTGPSLITDLRQID